MQHGSMGYRLLTPPSHLGSGCSCFPQVNASTVELVDLENYVNEVVRGKPIVLWNLELDTLRADLGESF